MNRNEANESYKMGSLPGKRAPLALSYVPMQTSAAPSYEAGDALARGTLLVWSARGLALLASGCF